jgi:threonine synthase
VPEASIAVAHARLARSGLYVEPTSATAVALLERLLGDGTIGGTDKVVVILTGSGLKAGELIARMLEEAAARH